MTPQQMNDFIDELYAATGAGDWDKVATMVTDDLVISEAPGLPMEGTYKGKNALRDLYIDVFKMLQVELLEMVERTFGGDHACCILKMHYGKGLEPAELVEMFRFRRRQGRPRSSRSITILPPCGPQRRPISGS